MQNSYREMATLPTIAVINGNQDILESIESALSADGYPVVKGHIDDIKHGRIDFVDWLVRHDPRIVIYDVGAPFELNLNFLRLVRETGSMKDRCLVVTTTNLKALHQIQPKFEAHEILGRPFDLGLLLDIVKHNCSNLRPAA